VEELWVLVIELRGVNAELRARNAGQAARIVELEHRLEADSSTSSRPAECGFALPQTGQALGAEGFGA
jgi:hypothetical protein